MSTINEVFGKLQQVIIGELAYMDLGSYEITLAVKLPNSHVVKTGKLVMSQEFPDYKGFTYRDYNGHEWHIEPSKMPVPFGFIQRIKEIRLEHSLSLMDAKSAIEYERIMRPDLFKTN